MDTKPVSFYLQDYSGIYEKRNKRAYYNVIFCSNSDKCELYKKGQCSLGVMYTWTSNKCPYGERKTDSGYTPRARKHRLWVNATKEKYKDVKKLEPPTKNKMAVVGEYIYLNYEHFIDDKNLPFVMNSNYYENPFMKMEDFNYKVVDALFVRRRSRISHDVMKRFVLHLKEQYPAMFIKLLKEHPEADNIFKELSHVGRKAKLFTLTPNIGEFHAYDRKEWRWDGNYLTSEEEGMLIGSICSFSEIRLKPRENTIIEITDDKQVNSDTIFID